MDHNFDINNLLNTLEHYKGELYVGVDIGGTNTRIAISCEDIFSPLFEYKFLCSSKDLLLKTLFQLEEVLKDTCQNIKDLFRVKASTLAIAGPISRFETFATITNYIGEKEEEKQLDVEELPFVLFPRNATKMINDLKGTCLGIVSLHHAGKLQEYFEFGWNDNEDLNSIFLDNKFSYLVMAVGTGLGTAAIVSLSPTQFEIVPLEGGHITMFHINSHHKDYPNELKLFEYLQDTVWEGNHQPEFEDILSGRGFKMLYKYFSKDIKNAPELQPEQISDTAIKNSGGYDKDVENACKETLLSYYKYHARAAKNLSILLQTRGGIFWAGDNLMANSHFLKENLPSVKEEFLDSAKRNWVENIPLFLQTKSVNFNMAGALYYARNI